MTTSVDPQVPTQSASRVVSLTIQELAALLKVELDNSSIDQNITFELRRVQQGTSLYRTGDPFTHIYAIRSGTFKSVLRDAKGKQQVLGFPMVSDVLGFDGLEAQYYCTEALALEDSEIAIVPFPWHARIRGNAQDLCLIGCRLISRQLKGENLQAWFLGLDNSDSRVAAFLLRLGERYAELGYSSTRFNLRMSRLDMGCFLGLTQETVSRVISRLDQTGAIRVRNKALQILDVEGLRRIAARSSNFS